uniref:Ig-like domain-containing protein n=1 Tax=Dicentrarchus labrax TaxID=13489 RepID=A0A8P4G4Y5_DICLA
MTQCSDSCVFPGDSSVRSPPETVLAFAGEAVILPCSFSPTASDDFPTVEWSKEDLQPNVVFLYRDGCETYEMKNPLFQYRTSFIPKELKNRNISLRISNVQLTDAGIYQCMRLWKNGHRDITTVELVVGTSSQVPALPVSVSVPRLMCHLLVGTPYLLSTILLGLIYRDRNRGKTNPVYASKKTILHLLQHRWLQREEAATTSSWK